MTIIVEGETRWMKFPERNRPAAAFITKYIVLGVFWEILRGGGKVARRRVPHPKIIFRGWVILLLLFIIIISYRTRKLQLYISGYCVPAARVHTSQKVRDRK
jgi:hypothetical protein